MSIERTSPLWRDDNQVGNRGRGGTWHRGGTWRRGGTWGASRQALAAGAMALGIAMAGLAAPISHTPVESDRSDETAQASAVVELSMTIEDGLGTPLSTLREFSHPELGEKGFNGQGIDVALIDSGVSPVPGLDGSDKILYGPDLSVEAADPALVNIDSYGHGTHMAGIIAANGGEVLGMAPETRIVSVKVAGADGITNLTQVIAGIDWVIEHGNEDGLNVRVLNLSLGMDHDDDPDGAALLAAAAERAWKAGIVVVAAVGNDGNGSGQVDSPASSPYVIAVGSSVATSAQPWDDRAAGWSNSGDGVRNPDIVAPGNSILSLRAPGSTLDQRHPEAVVDDVLFRGTGTSQSAAAASGWIASLLSRDASLSPDQVKFLVQKKARWIEGGEALVGEGRLDAADMAKSLKSKNRAPSQVHLTALDGLGITPWTEMWSGGSWSGGSWSGGSWSGASWSGASWSGGSWNGGSWSGGSWSGGSWSGGSWSGGSWSGGSWNGGAWSLFAAS